MPLPNPETARCLVDEFSRTQQFLREKDRALRNEEILFQGAGDKVIKEILSIAFDSAIQGNKFIRPYMPSDEKLLSVVREGLVNLGFTLTQAREKSQYLESEIKSIEVDRLLPLLELYIDSVKQLKSKLLDWMFLEYEGAEEWLYISKSLIPALFKNFDSYGNILNIKILESLESWCEISRLSSEDFGEDFFIQLLWIHDEGFYDASEPINFCLNKDQELSFEMLSKEALKNAKNVRLIQMRLNSLRGDLEKLNLIQANTWILSWDSPVRTIANNIFLTANSLNWLSTDNAKALLDDLDSEIRTYAKNGLYELDLGSKIFQLPKNITTADFMNVMCKLGFRFKESEAKSLILTWAKNSP